MAQTSPIRRTALPLIVAVILASCGCDFSFHHFPGGRSVRVTQKNDRSEIRIREQDNTLEFFCHGDVEFSSDDRGVVAVTDSFRVRENTGGHVRQAGFTASHAGIDIAYAVNRRATDFDADGEAWLARVIGRAVRETKLGAKQRAERILTQSGVMGVMAEIAAFEYQAPKTAYVNVLLANLESVPDEALVNLLVLAEEALSDSQTARLMDAIMDRAPEDQALTLAILDAANEIGSSSTRAKTLKTVAAKRKFTRPTAMAAITTASEISSSANCAAALIAILEAAPNDAALHRTYLDAVEEISSSMSQTKSIIALIERSDLDTDTWMAIATAIDEIPSTSCRGQALLKFLEIAPLDTEIWYAWLDTVKELSSSGTEEEVLLALLKRDGLEPAVLDRVARTIEEVSSSSARNRLEKALEEYQRSLESSL